MNSPPSSKQPDLAKFNFELLEAVACITDEDIDRVRQALMPVMTKTFDGMSENKRKILAALYQRDFEELAEAARSKIYFTGIHNIGNNLNFLLNAVPELHERWNKHR